MRGSFCSRVRQRRARPGLAHGEGPLSCWPERETGFTGYTAEAEPPGLTHEIAPVEQSRLKSASRVLKDPRRFSQTDAFRLDNCQELQPKAAHA